MKIAIDIRKINDFGIGTHIENLVTNLARIDLKNEYILFYKDEIPVNLDDSRFRFVRDSSGLYSIGELISIPLKLARYSADIFHSPHYTLPPVRPCPAVVTIHDLIHILFPQYLTSRFAYYYAKIMMRMAVKLAKIVITVSRASREDIIKYLKADPNKVRVIHNGVSEIFFPEFDKIKIENSLLEFGIKRPYILWVGNPKPHKNFNTLLRAFERLIHDFSVTSNLVVAGAGMKEKEILGLYIDELNLKENVLLLDCIPKYKMPSIYQGAEFLVFPSLYEGFGLPVVEAMACGIPVIASDRSSLPEVVGDAGLLINPISVDDIALAMYNLFKDKDLRSELSIKGIMRAKNFSWKKMAEETLKVYHESRNYS